MPLNAVTFTVGFSSNSSTNDECFSSVAAVLFGRAGQKYALCCFCLQ